MKINFNKSRLKKILLIPTLAFTIIASIAFSNTDKSFEMVKQIIKISDC